MDLKAESKFGDVILWVLLVMRAIVFCTDSLYSVYMLEAFRDLYEYSPLFEGSQAIECSEISATFVSVSEDFDIYQHLCVNL
jgi:hypothetical protein